MAIPNHRYVKNSIRYSDMLYATLDCTPPNDNGIGHQHEFLKIPDGWSLAGQSEGLAENVIGKLPWGTHCLVLCDGSSLATSGFERSDAGPGQQFGNNPQLAMSLDCEFKPKDKSRRVLICRPSGDGQSLHSQQTLAAMWESSEFTDCELVSKGNVFKCHRAVLAQVSPVFKRMFSGSMLEAKDQRVELNDVEKEVVIEFLAFVYTSEVSCNSQHFSAFVKLADYYQLNCFTGPVAEKMVDAVDKDNVISILRLMKGMRERPHIAQHWKTLLAKVQACSELTEAVVAEV